jgi:uncharacterized protein YbjT (DUF2867 family)
MSDTRELDVVTGAFGYTGKYITRRLLSAGRRVRTITRHANRRHEFGDRVEVAPLDFRDSAGLERSLRGARVLYNTYWVRFNHGRATFDEAVANSRALIQAARAAGVTKIVHLSIANPSLDSPLPYYSGKARVEQAIVDSGLRYVILRPTVIFGPEDILINNIAWFTRRFPAFAIPGTGRYELQPIFVEDVADLAFREAQSATNRVLDAVGPEKFAFEHLIRRIAHAVGKSPRLIHLSHRNTLRMLQILGRVLGDIILTQEEIDGLTGNLLVSERPPTGRTLFTEWLSKNVQTLGTRYSSELRKHYR